MENNKVRRPIRRSDFVVIFAEFVFNLSQAVTALLESLYELSIYNSNRATEEAKAWETMSQDLENLEEEADGR